MIMVMGNTATTNDRRETMTDNANTLRHLESTLDSLNCELVAVRPSQSSDRWRRATLNARKRTVVREIERVKAGNVTCAQMLAEGVTHVFKKN
jgi:hypothetical protein